MNTPTLRRNASPLPFLAAVVACTLIAACSQQAPNAPTAPPASTRAEAQATAAANEFKAYRNMLDQHAEELAAPIGREILEKYPGTPAAAEVQKTLPQVEATARKKAEHQRLAALWYYQTANVGGLQHTASTYSQPQSATSVRLVLRRHVKWGQSVYLFAPDGSKGFVCKDVCDTVMRFDGKREVWKTYLPKTGEPAMFIKEDKRFIAAMQKAQVIDMDVTLKGSGRQTLKFEVGGYDPAKFLPLPRK